MTRKMTVGAAAAAFFGTILAASATGVAGVAWNAEFTNTWFVADMSSVASPWVPPASGTAGASDGAVVFETEVGDPLRYVPAAPSGPVALVNVQMVVDPNAATPPTDGLEYAQAALSVVTNNEGYLEWIGLTKDSGLKWEKLYGDNPTSGSTYDVQIAVDNHGNDKKIRYAVKGAGAFTVLTNSSGNAWLANPQAAATSVTNVAFAGAGTIKSLGGSNVVDKVVVDSFSDSVTNGYDFTNGTITAVVTMPSGVVSGRKAKLEVSDTSGTSLVTISDKQIGSASSASVEFALPALTAGAAYTYVFSIDYGDGNYVQAKSGTFVAANWSSDDDCLFSGKVVGTSPQFVNGEMIGADPRDNKWNVDTNAVFKVTDTDLGANQVTRVDTSYLFDSFIDVVSLEELDNTAVGGIVAVSNGGNAFWYAWTSDGWQALAGDIAPKTNTEYVVRAEFDFKSARKVCYYVSEGNSDAFCPLTLGGNMMIAFANDSVTTTLSSVEMAGKGSVKSICAKLADASVAKVGDVKYGSLWEAVKAAGGTITLLTNATLAPSGVTGGKYQFSLTGDFSYILDKSGLTGAWKLVKDGEGNLYLVKPAATYIFF